MFESCLDWGVFHCDTTLQGRGKVGHMVSTLDRGSSDPGWSPEWDIIVLCSSASRVTLSVLLSTEVYEFNASMD